MIEIKEIREALQEICDRLDQAKETFRHEQLLHATSDLTEYDPAFWDYYEAKYPEVEESERPPAAEFPQGQKDCLRKVLPVLDKIIQIKKDSDIINDIKEKSAACKTVVEEKLSELEALDQKPHS